MTHWQTAKQHVHNKVNLAPVVTADESQMNMVFRLSEITGRMGWEAATGTRRLAA